MPASDQDSNGSRTPETQVLNYELCEDKGNISTSIGVDYDFPDSTFDKRGALPHGLEFDEDTAEIRGSPAETGSFDIYTWAIVGSMTREYPITINVARTDSGNIDHEIIGNQELNYRLPNPIPHSCVNGFTMTSHTLDLTANDWITVESITDTEGNGKKLIGTVPNISADKTLTFTVTGYLRVIDESSSQTRDISYTYNVRINLYEDILPDLSLIQPITLNVGAIDLTVPGSRGNGTLIYNLAIIGQDEPGVNSSNFRMKIRPSSEGYALITGFSKITRSWSAYTYTVTDADGDTDSSTIFIRVVDHLQFRNNPVAEYSFSVGDTVNELLPVAIGGSLPYNYSLTQVNSSGQTVPGFPEGLVFDSSLVKLEGTPTSAFASAIFSLKVRDSSTVNVVTTNGIELSNQGKVLSITFNLEVLLDLLDSDDGKLFASQVGRHFEHTFFNIESDPTDYLSISHSTLPQGLYISPITRSGSLVDNYELVLAGYPSIPSSFTSYTLTLTDNTGNEETITFQIAVSPNLIPITIDDTPSQFTPSYEFCGNRYSDLAFMTENTQYRFTNGYYSNWELPIADIGNGSVKFRIGNNPVPGYSLVLTYGLRLQAISRLDDTGTLVHVPVLFGTPTTSRSRSVYICIEVLNGGVVADRIPINLVNYTPADQRMN